jgi:hypothetical protein
MLCKIFSAAFLVQAGVLPCVVFATLIGDQSDIKNGRVIDSQSWTVVA